MLKLVCYQLKPNTIKTLSSDITNVTVSYDNIPKSDIALLASNKNITYLDLTNNDLNSNDAIILSSSTSITCLTVSNDDFGDNGCYYTNKIGDIGLDALLLYSHLQQLYIVCNEITDNGLKNIVTNTKLETLDIRCNIISNDGLKLLAHNKSVIDLYIGNNNITDIGLSYFFNNNTTLCTLNIENYFNAKLAEYYEFGVNTVNGSFIEDMYDNTSIIEFIGYKDDRIDYVCNRNKDNK